MTAWGFDSDVLIYAAIPDHELGGRVIGLLNDVDTERFGSVLLLPEVLAKPLADGRTAETTRLTSVVALIGLLPCDEATARLAVRLGGSYRLRAADAVHLATAVLAGADAFLTNNRKDFPKSIAEIAIVYPDELDDPTPVTGSR